MYERNVNNAKAYLGYGSGARDRNGNVVPPIVLAQAPGHGRSALPSPNRGPEEQKRATSVASGDTIISTASSNSPLKGRRGKRDGGLAINGSAIPSTLQAQRRPYQKLGARHSPYVKKGGALVRNQSNSRVAQGGSNTDGELYGGKSVSLAR